MIFDLHADTIKLLKINNESLYKNSLMLDIERMKQAGYIGQVFAVFSKMHQDTFESTLEIIDYYNNELDKNKDSIMHINSYMDFLFARSNNKIASVLAVEELGIIDNSFDKLNKLIKAGVLIYCLCWNYDNQILSPASPSNDNIIMHKDGLTDFGRKVILYLDSKGKIIDLSHASDTSFYECLDLISSPVIVSHSNCRKVCDNMRNLSDDMILKLHENGGVMGLNYYSKFVSNKENYTIDDLILHIIHIKELRCIDNIALGSDFDGITKSSVIDSPLDIYKITDALIKNDFTKEEIDKIYCLNFIRVLKGVTYDR